MVRVGVGRVGSVLTALALWATLPSGAGAEATTCGAAPAQEPLYLRGGMNGWVPAPEYRLDWDCDAYVLAVDLQGMQDFKLADAAWTPASSFGGTADSPPRAATGPVEIPIARAESGGSRNLSFRFDGEHRLRLDFPDGAPRLTITPGGGASAAPATNDPAAAHLRFDSRNTAHKAPFGAQPAGTPVRFTLGTGPGVRSVTLVVERRVLEGNQEHLAYLEPQRIPLTRQTDGSGWSGEHRFDTIGVYGYWFEVATDQGTLIVQNNTAPIYWTRERGANGPGTVAPAPTDPDSIRRFRHTVYDPGFTVPGWARDAVYYYIFPERFRNGDPANDPRVGVDTYQDKGVEVHGRWLSVPYRPGSGDGSDAVSSNDFFGGDLAGIIEKLDHIRDVGANTIYMTPVFQAASNHKYDTADYRMIDSRFGTNADFERLVAAAAERGIRVIVDVSLNHTGRDSPYFDRFAKWPGIGALEGGQVRADSPYADWYRLNPDAADPDDRYVGWTGAKDLPELNEASPAFRRFAYGAPDGVMQLWLDRGAAGWRMDVAPWVPDDFWREWRQAVKAHRPDALTIAETWFDSSKYFLGDTFDTTMNYIFRNAVLDFAAGGNAAANYRNIELMREVYPPQSFFALMNLLSTHDAARSLHVLGDHGHDPAAADLAKRRYRLALLFQMTFPGAPAIFYGDEVGLGGGDDPDNRRPFPWADQGGSPDMEMLATVRQLTGLRRDHAILRHGSLSAPLYTDRNLIILLRELDGQPALVALNNGEEARTLSLPLPPTLTGRTVTDLLTGREMTLPGDTLSLEVPALGGVVLVGGK
ncbi:MAG: hypothetical protein RLY86_3423 [Pseudomonadota bacterium]